MTINDKLAVNARTSTRHVKQYLGPHLNANNNTTKTIKPNSIKADRHKAIRCDDIDKSRSSSDEPVSRTSENLSDITRIDTQIVLNKLHAKFSMHKYYTEASANTLIALNPFKHIAELYSLPVMEFYHKTKLDDTVPAHIYKHAANAWNTIKRTSSNQTTILVSGDSGSGKTKTINLTIQYYAHTTPATKRSMHIKNILLKTNLILESFGNAKTALNDNSSRFGKYIKLYFSRSSNELVSAQLTTYLLEKTRTVSSAPGLNFHIFYELMLGASQAERAKFLLDQPLLDHYASHGLDHHHQHHSLYTHKLDQLKLSFSLIHLNTDTIFSIISAIAHLNCWSPLFSDEARLRHASSLLGLRPADLTDYLLVHQLRIGHSHADLVQIPCNHNQTKMRQHALIKLVYNQLFKHLVKCINNELEFAANGRLNCIALLDIYGFESIHNANSLEQLCINYANEKLHGIFVDSYFKLNKLDYETEFPLEQFPIEYTDNRPLLELIESPQGSLFAVLNEHSILNSRDHLLDDEHLLLKIEQTLAHTGLVYQPRINCANEFYVRHYAGQVAYRAESMASKNGDHVPADLLALISTSDTLARIAASHVKKLTSIGHKKPTVLAKFKTSLDQLIDNLSQTNILYVRCVKPNCELMPGYFDVELVRGQLESCGIVSLLNLCKEGFMHKFVYAAFVERFVAVGFLRRGRAREVRRAVERAEYKRACVSVVEVSGARADSYRLGANRIFLKEALVQTLNALVDRAEALAAGVIQRQWKRYRRRVCDQAAATIQRWWRRYTHRLCSSFCLDNASLVGLRDHGSLDDGSSYLIELDIVDKKLNMIKK